MSNEKNNENLVNEEIVEETVIEEAVPAKKAKKMRSPAQMRKLKYGGTATTITVIGIIVVIIINMIATALTNRFGLSFDMTRNELFKVGEQTIEHIKDIDKEVNIYILVDEKEYKSQNIYYESAGEIIESYSQVNSNIKVEYVDIITNPTFVSQFPDLTLAESNVVVSCGDRAVVLTQQDLLSAAQNTTTGAYDLTSTAEQSITSAILTVTSGDMVKVAILNGFESGDAAGIESVFKSNYYEVTQLSIQTEEIDPETDIIVLFGIKNDLDSESVEKIEKFLANDELQRTRALYYFVSTETSLEEMENFGTLLNDWGISVSTDYIYETSSSHYLSGYPFYTIPDIVNTDVSGGIEEKNLFLAMSYARKVDLVHTNNYSNEAMVQFSDSARALAFDAEEIPKLNDISDEKSTSAKGACAVAASTSTTKYDANNNPCNSHIVVFASDVSFSPSMMSSSYYANADYLKSLSNVVTDSSSYVYIEPKDLNADTMVVKQSQVTTVMATFMIILPVAVLVIGTVVYIRRRHR
ncbi:MAG: Gldg family protein [Oscillospiraceae bacterium]|nr:Gldg family protein [Oscillospiraceae bacterium]